MTLKKLNLFFWRGAHFLGFSNFIYAVISIGKFIESTNRELNNGFLVAFRVIQFVMLTKCAMQDIMETTDDSFEV